MIGLVALGGTIASVPGAADGLLRPELDAAALLGATARTVDDPIVARTVTTKLSPALTLDDLLAAVTVMTELVADGARGLVVSCGTSALAEVCFLLSLLWGEQVPVCVTGAMRPVGDPSSDAPRNLADAIAVSASRAGRSWGVTACFDGTVLSPRHVTKLHPTRLGSFGSPRSGALGWITDHGIRQASTALRPPVFRTADLAPCGDVVTVTPGLGESPLLLDALPVAGLAGVVLDGMGPGQVPPGWMPGTRRLVARVPVVYCTRAGEGEAQESTYGFQGSESDLIAAGAWNAGDLDAARARLTLQLAVATTTSTDAARTSFRAVADLGLDTPDGTH